MGEHDRHIFLYAKNHYQTTVEMEDIRKVIGKRNGIDPKHISNTHIISVLMKIVWNYINHETDFHNFIYDLHPENVWRHGIIEYDFNEAVISKCLSVLAFQKIRDIPFDLGAPDSTILPIKNIKTK